MSWSWFGKKQQTSSKSTLMILFDDRSVDIRLTPAIGQTDEDRDLIASTVAQIVVLLSSGQLSPYLQEAVAAAGMSRERTIQSLGVIELAMHPRSDPKNRDADAVSPTQVFAQSRQQAGGQ